MAKYKYIDAEKLIAEIEKRQEYLEDHNFHSMASEYDWLLTMVQSLQQEQPEGLHFTPLNRLIQKIPSKNWNDTVNNYAKKLRDCLIKEGYLKDAKVLQNYISYMNGNNVPMATMDEQEKPEVDLENNGWIDCRKQMPKETKQRSDTLQGHGEWTESKPVIAWDSMYGCRIDWTRNGKWMSEQTGEYTGQVCHGIIAWRPIPEYKERQ